MATAISPANFDNALGECYDAIAADNLTGARKWATLAEVQLNGLASSATFGGDTTSMRQSLEGVRKAIDDLAAKSANYRYEIHTIWVPK